MTIANWVTLGVSLLVYFVGFIISWARLDGKVSRIENDVEKMVSMVKEQDEYAGNNYVRKDIFDTCLRNLQDDLAELNRLNLPARFAKIETQQTNIMTGQSKIELQLTELQKDITELRRTHK